MYFQKIEVENGVFQLFEELSDILFELGGSGDRREHPVNIPELEGSGGIDLVVVEDRVEPAVGDIEEVRFDLLQGLMRRHGVWLVYYYNIGWKGQ